METQTNSLQYERKRKFFMVLPVFAAPLLTVFFFLLGGGKGDALAAQKGAGSKGFNMNLPGALLKDQKDLTKMSFYEQADKDSASLKQKMASDPYFGKANDGGVKMPGVTGPGSLQSIQENLLKQHPELKSAVGTSPLGTGISSKVSTDPNEQKVYQKIAELNQVLNAAAPTPVHTSNYDTPPIATNSDMHNDVTRLEQMLQGLKGNDNSGQDPQLKQLDGMLDKIMAIQNPPSRDSLQRLSVKNKGKTYPVTTPAGEDSISLLQPVDTTNLTESIRERAAAGKTVGFYGLDDEGYAKANAQSNVITAAVDESQTLVSGANIKMRLTSDMYVDGALIPSGTPLTGLANLSGERLKVEVSSISYQNSIYPVKLSVYDVDGVAGIYIPGSINREVSKESADQAIGDMNLMSLDQSVGAQAAAAGIQAAKTLMSKKIRLVRVTVKDGYQVLLKDSGATN